MRINKQSENIEDYTFADFELIGYNPHEPLKMKMAICTVCFIQQVQNYQFKYKKLEGQLGHRRHLRFVREEGMMERLVRSDSRLRIVVQHPIQQIPCVIWSAREQGSRLLRFERLAELDVLLESLHFLHINVETKRGNRPIFFFGGSKQIKNGIQISIPSNFIQEKKSF